MKPRITFFMLLLFSCFGCEVEVQTDLELPQGSAKAVVFGIANTNTFSEVSAWQVAPINQYEPDKPLTVLSARIVSEGQIIYEFPIGNGSKLISDSILGLSVSKHYMLELDTKEFGQIKSSPETLPPLATIDSLQLSAPIDTNTNRQDLHIFFKSNCQNCFLDLKITHYYTLNGKVETIEPSRVLPSVFLDYSKFQDGFYIKKSSEFSLIDEDKRIFFDSTKVSLFSFSEGWATFIKSVSQNEGTVADPLLEPFIVEGNLIGAFGAFALMQKDSFMIIR